MLCNKCGKDRPEIDFYYDKRRKIFKKPCKFCARKDAKARNDRRRKLLGDEKWYEEKRKSTKKSRQKRNYDKERSYNRAKGRAYRELAHRHQVEFYKLLQTYLKEERADEQ